MSDISRYQPLTAYLSVRDAAAAILFYEQAFGAKLIPPTLRTPDGTIMHAEMDFGGARLMFSEEAPEMGGPSPQSLGGTTLRLNLMVDNADEAVAKAVAAGAVTVTAVADQFFGHRSGRVRDPFGHLWIISHEIEQLSEAEMQRRMDEMMRGG
ncbi:MAG: VOC family protein [Neomegalonema sp.]|nr:VOC family protein [Neomegalonema sp.]